jgi:putative protein-disulfide isomerase
MIYTYLFTMIFSFSLDQPEPKIIYVGDPMCSWCYGIAPELQKLQEHYTGSIDIEVVAGGLRPYNTETMTELADFLKEHWEDVERASGQPFKTEILKEETYVYDTEPACRALVVVRQMKAEAALDFFRLIQEDFYSENKYLMEAEAFRSSVEEVGLDFGEFQDKFNSDQLKLDVKQDFYKASQLGVRSFPTILLLANGRTTIIANGYSTAEEMTRKIESLLGQSRG